MRNPWKRREAVTAVEETVEETLTLPLEMPAEEQATEQPAMRKKNPLPSRRRAFSLG